MTRILVSTRRRVPAERLDPYTSAWHRLRTSVEARGGRAWLFRSAGRPDVFMEFVESDGPEPLSADPAVIAALEALDQVAGGGEAEEWREA